MKYLIVNADDFGLTKGVNQGIIRSYAKGILTSATLMANLPAFEDAVALSKAHPDLGIGVHLNLTEGKSVSPPEIVPTLVGNDGKLISDYQLVLRKLFSRQLDLNEVKTEFSAQLEKLKQARIQPTHLDSHKHLHIFPGIIDVVIHLAQEYNINKIRLPLESNSFINSSLLSNNWNKKVALRQYINLQFLAFFSRLAVRKFRKNGIKANDSFFGIRYTGFLNAQVLAQVINHLPSGYCEIMVHPGYYDAELDTMNTRLLQHREMEMQALQAAELKTSLAENKVNLINYAQLN